MALESTITKSIQVSAKARGWWVMKVAGGGFQRPGIPDLLCVKHGRAVFLEVKQPGKKRQLPLVMAACTLKSSLRTPDTLKCRPLVISTVTPFISMNAIAQVSAATKN